MAKTFKEMFPGHTLSKTRFDSGVDTGGKETAKSKAAKKRLKAWQSELKKRKEKERKHRHSNKGGKR